MASSVNLTNLVNYVNELNAEIQTSAVLKGNFVDQIDHFPGVKSIQALPILSSTIVATDPTCGTVLSPTGSVTMFQNMLTVVESQVTMNLCKKDFDTKYFGARDSRGINPENIDKEFAKAFSAEIINKVQDIVEGQLIVGSSTGTFSSVANYNRINGVLHNATLTSATSSIVNAGVTHSYSATTAIAVIDKIIGARPKAMLREDGQRLWLSYADFSTLVTALRNANLFAYNDLEKQGVLKWEFYFPGTNVLITACSGLDAVSNVNYSHWAFLTTERNLVFGYDDDSEYEKFDLTYESLTRSVYFVDNFKTGIMARDWTMFVLAKFN